MNLLNLVGGRIFIVSVTPIFVVYLAYSIVDLEQDRFPLPLSILSSFMMSFLLIHGCGWNTERWLSLSLALNSLITCDSLSLFFSATFSSTWNLPSLNLVGKEADISGFVDLLSLLNDFIRSSATFSWLRILGMGDCYCFDVMIVLLPLRLNMDFFGVGV